MGRDARASTQEEFEDRQVQCPSQEGPKLRNQPRLKDHQAHRNSKGSKQPKARKTGPPPHYVYRWMPQELAVLTCSKSYRQSPGSTRRGTFKSTQSLVTSRVQGRKVPTYVQVREKLRSQPGLKDHQAHRYSKRSQQSQARKTGPLPHYVYRWMHQDQVVATISQRKRQSPGSARRGTRRQPRNSSRQVSKYDNPTGLLRVGHVEVRETDKFIAMKTCGTSRRKSMKHRPELQVAHGKSAETDQARCEAIKVEPPRTPWAPTQPNAWGDAPPQEQPHAKDWYCQRRHGARGATLRTWSTNKTDAKKSGWYART